MKKAAFIAIAGLCFLPGCQQNAAKGPPLTKIDEPPVATGNQPPSYLEEWIDPAGKTVESRIRTAPGFMRIEVAENSFAKYLRQLPLKPHPAKVLYYNGRIKENHGVYEAVVDLKIGNKNLHQCADAVMRLRAEYLFKQKQFDKIHFNFSNGFRADYSEWMRGKRIVVRGNQTYWIHTHHPDTAYPAFWDYLEEVFSYAGTRSLAKELVSVSMDDLQIGDVFIHGGSPGHAIIVVDLAMNPHSNQKAFLLAQSYMPAQEIQILKNPNSQERSPWYGTDFGEVLVTPEWLFQKTELKRFREQ